MPTIEVNSNGDANERHDIIPSVSIENMVNQRAAVMQRINAAFALIQEAADLAAAANVGMPRVLISTSYGRGTHGLDVAAARIKTDSSGRPWSIDRSPQTELDKHIRLGIDCAAWQFLMHESGLRTFMDTAARKAWDSAIHDGEVPEFTANTVRDTFGTLHDTRGEMFERGVIECFKGLSWHYKTNQPQKFGKRIVLTYMRDSITAGRYGSGSTTLGSVNFGNSNRLDDLTRVMSVLDGKPEPDHRQGWYGLLSKVNRTTDPDAANDYLSVRSFRNGNGHVTFKRLELVDVMNRILAKHYPNALPAPK